MLKIRRPLGRLIFNMGIAIPGKTVFLIETAPWQQDIIYSDNDWAPNKQDIIVKKKLWQKEIIRNSISFSWPYSKQWFFFSQILLYMPRDNQKWYTIKICTGIKSY